MLQLAGNPDLAALDKEYQAALAGDQQPAWWKLMDHVSSLWPAQPLEDFKKDEANLFRADRLTRVLAPFDLAAVRSTVPAPLVAKPTPGPVP